MDQLSRFLSFVPVVYYKALRGHFVTFPSTLLVNPTPTPFQPMDRFSFSPFLLLSQSSSVSGATGFAAAGGAEGQTTPCPVVKGTWLVLYCGGNAKIEQVKAANSTRVTTTEDGQLQKKVSLQN